jgi:hypothetical protein
VVFVYFSRRALSLTGVGLMGWCPGIYTCVGTFKKQRLCFETATWDSTSSPTCDLCEANDDVRGEKYVIIYCMYPLKVRNFLSMGMIPGCVCFFTPVLRFFHQINNKLYLNLHGQFLLYGQASSHTF